MLFRREALKRATQPAAAPAAATTAPAITKGVVFFTLTTFLQFDGGGR